MWRFSDAMAESNRDKGEVTLFRFHRISDLKAVGLITVFLVQSCDCNKFPCLGKSHNESRNVLR